MSFIYSKFHEDYRFVNKYEKAILLVKPKNELISKKTLIFIFLNLAKNYPPIDEKIGKSYSDLQKLRDTRDARMRDEQM